MLVFSVSLITLPKFAINNVVKTVESIYSTKSTKLDKEYKFFHKEFYNSTTTKVNKAHICYAS